MQQPAGWMVLPTMSIWPALQLTDKSQTSRFLGQLKVLLLF